MDNEEPVPKLPAAYEAPLFLHKPLDGLGQDKLSADVRVSAILPGFHVYIVTTNLVQRWIPLCSGYVLDEKNALLPGGGDRGQFISLFSP